MMHQMGPGFTDWSMYARLMPLSGAVLAGAGDAAVVALAAVPAGAGAEALGDCCEQAVQAQATAAARISVVRGMGISGGQSPNDAPNRAQFQVPEVPGVGFPDRPRRPRASKSKDDGASNSRPDGYRVQRKRFRKVSAIC
jgi:hypothetical protein